MFLISHVTLCFGCFFRSSLSISLLAVVFSVTDNCPPPPFLDQVGPWPSSSIAAHVAGGLGLNPWSECIFWLATQFCLCRRRGTLFLPFLFSAPHGIVTIHNNHQRFLTDIRSLSLLLVPTLMVVHSSTMCGNDASLHTVPSGIVFLSSPTSSLRWSVMVHNHQRHFFTAVGGLFPSLSAPEWRFIPIRTVH